MTSVTKRYCDFCGKELGLERVEINVYHDDRTLVYYMDKNRLDACPDCYAKMRKAVKEEASC